MASAPPAIPSLDSTMGATFIGVVIAAALYGACCLQAWSYYRDYPSDSSSLKTLVFVVWACDTIHQILITHAIYVYLVTNYFNPPFLGQLEWSIIVEVLFNSFSAIIVQTFFTVRIYTLSNKNFYLVVPVAALVLAQFIAYLVYVTKALQMDNFVELGSLKNLTLAINAVTAATDVAIAAILCILLHGSRTGFKRSDSMINRLMVYTVNTGLLTSVDAACALATHAAKPDTFIYITFFFLLGRLYSNSLLATLNARKTIRQNTTQDDSISLGLGFSRSRVTAGAGNPGQNIAISVDMRKEYNVDAESQLRSQTDTKVDPQVYHAA